MPLALLLLASPSLTDRLIGSWRVDDSVTTFSKGGTGTAAGGTFTWKLDDSRLEVTYDDGSVLLANIELKGDTLIEVDVVDTDTRRFKRVKAPSRDRLIGHWYEGATRRTYSKTGDAILPDGTEAKWHLEGTELVITRPDKSMTRAVVLLDSGKGTLTETDTKTGRVTHLVARP